MQDHSSTKTALVNALYKLSTELSASFAPFLEFFSDLYRSMLLPLLQLFVAGFLAFYLLSGVYRLVVPISARELHNQALQALACGRTKQAERLLRKAVRRNDSWRPAFLSLAALYIYRLRSASKAKEVLAHRTCQHADFDLLRMDAEALATGNTSMLLDVVGQEEYLSPCAAALAKYK